MESFNLVDNLPIYSDIQRYVKNKIRCGIILVENDYIIVARDIFDWFKETISSIDTDDKYYDYVIRKYGEISIKKLNAALRKINGN